MQFRFVTGQREVESQPTWHTCQPDLFTEWEDSDNTGREGERGGEGNRDGDRRKERKTERTTMNRLKAGRENKAKEREREIKTTTRYKE